MEAVHNDLYPKVNIIDVEKEFIKYAEGFNAEQTSVIQYEGKDIGR